MIIEETSIVDVQPENIDEVKIGLAENVMESVFPLLDEIYAEKLKQKGLLEQELQEKEIELKKKKGELDRLLAKFKKKKKIKELFNWTSKLVDNGIIHEGKMRGQVIVLLKVAEDISEEKLDYNIINTKKLVEKRYRS